MIHPLYILIGILFIILNNCESINPANYIWINFREQVPILPLGNEQFRAALPCEARIGKCSCIYTLLPLKWLPGSECSLIIPIDDVIKNGIYAIKSQMSEQTGEKISADLVLNVERRRISIIDRSTFMNINGIVQTSTNNPTANNFETSPILPDGFPSLENIRSVILSGNVYSISKSVNEILGQYAPCRAKLTYLNSVKKILDEVISQNDLAFKTSQSQIKNLQDTLANFDIQRRDLVKNARTQFQIADVRSKLTVASLELSSLMAQQAKYKNLAKELLQNLTNWNSTSHYDYSKRLESMQQTLLKVDKWLENAYNSRKILRKGYLDSKLNNFLDRFNLNQNQYEVREIINKYNKNAYQLVIKEIEKIENSIKINHSQQKNEEYRQMKQEKDKYNFKPQISHKNTNNNKTEATKIQQFRKQNSILTKSLSNMQQILSIISRNCHN